MSIADFKPELCYTVLTDAGSQVRMIESEIHEYFYIGEYIAHCLYLHPADREERDEELWNLACDIVAEYTVDCLGMPFLTGEAGKEKTEVYRLFWKGKKSRTAAQIYDMLREGEFGKSCTDAWRSLFFTDGHSLWRMLSKGELAGIRDVWEKAAAYTSRDAGNEIGRASCRERV